MRTPTSADRPTLRFLRFTLDLTCSTSPHCLHIACHTSQQHPRLLSLNLKSRPFRRPSQLKMPLPNITILSFNLSELKFSSFSHKALFDPRYHLRRQRIGECGESSYQARRDFR